MEKDERFFPRFSSAQLIAMTFLGLILTGTLLLMLPLASEKGTSLAFVDALFTATSASCVTGLIVVDTGTYFSWFGHLVLICLIQLGGLGIMTFATLFSVAFGKKINLQNRLRIQESLNQSDVSGVVRLCMHVVKYTLCIEAFFGTILAFHLYGIYGLKGIVWGYWHSVSAFCNAGFDLFGGYRSITPFVGDWTINLCIIMLIILGGLGFPVMEDILHIRKRKFSGIRLHSKIVLVSTGVLIVGGTGLIWFLEAANPDTLGVLTGPQQFLASLFQAVSPRTAGFNSIALDKMTNAGIFTLIILMFIGASPTSTGGGIKTTTFAVTLLSTWHLLRGKAEIVVFNRRIRQEAINKSFIITVIALMWVTGGTLCMAYLEEDMPFINLLFEMVSAFATVGLTTGVTQHIGTESKIILILTMFAGRVGILTFALALMNKPKPDSIRYPDENIMIG